MYTEKRAGRPLILGSHALTSYGHYVVITGFNGTDYRTAKIIVNDPNGRWNGKIDDYTRANGKGLEYSLVAVANSTVRGVFVLRP